MKLTPLVRNLEKRLRKAETLAKRYRSTADLLRKRLASVAMLLGQRALVSTKLRLRRRLSAAGRASIQLAQKKRWAASPRTIRRSQKPVIQNSRSSLTQKNRRDIKGGNRRLPAGKRR